MHKESLDAKFKIREESDEERPKDWERFFLEDRKAMGHWETGKSGDESKRSEAGESDNDDGMDDTE